MLELAAMRQASRSGITLQQIADRFEVSRRTANRMLGALQEVFVDIETTSRDGRKYWHLPRPSPSDPLQVPAEIEDLAKRVDDLKAEIDDVRATGAMNEAIVDDALANSAIGIFILDANFRVVWTNEALRRYFGLKADDVHGKDKRKLIRNRIRHIMVWGEEFERRILETYAHNSHVERFECCVKSGPGRERRWLRHWSQPIRSGIYSGGRVEHYIDLSSQPEFEDQLPGELAHSIRNPLATLMAAAEGAHIGLFEPGAAIEDILRSAWRISAVVTDILRLVRDGEQTLEPAGVSGMVQEAVDELQGFAAERRVSLRIEGKPVSSSILVNRGLIIVALSDLIRNAIEAIEHDGTVTIRAERDAISKRVRITISDSGPGIAAEILDQVTKSKFTTKVDGTGLGLAVVRRIVDSHFGRLSIGGGNGSGAVVVIELPDSPE